MFLGNDGSGGSSLDTIMKNMTALQKRSEDIRKAVKNNSKFVKLVDNVVYLRNRNGQSRIYAPECLRNDFIQYFHEQYSHPSVMETLQVIRRHFDWLHSKEHVENFCRNCPTCEKNKTIKYAPTSKFKPIEAYNPLDVISVDIFGPIVHTDSGNSKIIVVMDIFSKFTELYPVSSASIEACKNDVSDFLQKYGKPKFILTERITTFTSEGWIQYCREQDVKI